MKYGIVSIAAIPLRMDASEKSEMLTQLVFGDMVEIQNEDGNWFFVRNEFDNYLGWADKKMIIQVTPDEYEQYIEGSLNIVTRSLISRAKVIHDESEILIPAGATLPRFSAANNTFAIDKRKYLLLNPPESFSNPVREQVCNDSLQFLNAPYLWGGKNPFGIDCSGLTQICYKINGYSLPRDARQQVSVGKTLSFLAEAKPGDLAFFDNAEGNIVHVGILLTPETIIHASGRVRIDRIDHQGIFNQDLQKYTHKLRVIKTILDQ